MMVSLELSITTTITNIVFIVGLHVFFATVNVLEMPSAHRAPRAVLFESFSFAILF